MIYAITPARTRDHPDHYPGQSDYLAECDEIFYRFALPRPDVPCAGPVCTAADGRVDLRLTGVDDGPDQLVRDRVDALGGTISPGAGGYVISVPWTAGGETVRRDLRRSDPVRGRGR